MNKRNRLVMPLVALLSIGWGVHAAEEHKQYNLPPVPTPTIVHVDAPSGPPVPNGSSTGTVHLKLHHHRIP